MEIIRGVVELYDAASHTVAVRPEQSPGALLDEVPLARDCPAELAQPGQALAVMVWDDGALLAVAPLGGGPTWPTGGVSFESGNTPLSSTVADQELPHPTVAVTLETVYPARFWVWQMTNWNCATLRTPLGYVQVELNGAPLPPMALLGYAAAGKWYALPLCFATPDVYPPGSYTLRPRFHFYFGGDATQTTSTTLSVLALPA
ncbi:MAG: hypothetical protein GXY68_04265 [Chloroflexi bacterium]|jgi:hypothetical protein|nr:hypothetical protein [Chloroflexota bacterium]